jgi:mRNA interferase RelE/StbE
MDKYTVVFAHSARKELESLPASIIERILPRINNLADVPRPSGCRKLTGERNLWRLRVGDYRVIYSVDDRRRIVDVNAVRNRRDAYR